MHRDVHYAYLQLSDHHMYNAAGRSLGNTVGRAEMKDCVVFATGIVNKAAQHNHIVAMCDDYGQTLVVFSWDDLSCARWTESGWSITHNLGTVSTHGDLEKTGPTSFTHYDGRNATGIRTTTDSGATWTDRGNLGTIIQRPFVVDGGTKAKLVMYPATGSTGWIALKQQKIKNGEK